MNIRTVGRAVTLYIEYLWFNSLVCAKHSNIQLKSLMLVFVDGGRSILYCSIITVTGQEMVSGAHGCRTNWATLIRLMRTNVFCFYNFFKVN